MKLQHFSPRIVSNSRHSVEVLAEDIQKVKRPRHFFTKMTDTELLDYAKKIAEEKGIKNRGGLQKADRGLYKVLRKRNLLDEVIPEKREERDWSSMSNEDLISHARKFIEENEIKNRVGLKKADNGLYQVLKKRNLLDVVFADIERARKIEAIRQIIEATKEFGS